MGAARCIKHATHHRGLIQSAHSDNENYSRLLTLAKQDFLPGIINSLLWVYVFAGIGLQERCDRRHKLMESYEGDSPTKESSLPPHRAATVQISGYPSLSNLQTFSYHLPVISDSYHEKCKSLDETEYIRQ